MLNVELLTPIKRECQRFFKESKGLPVLKNLPITYGDGKKVKVRHIKNRINLVDEGLEEAFDSPLFRQRAICTNGPSSLDEVLGENLETHDLYFVFIPDDFKFIYNLAVPHSDFSRLEILGSTSLISEVLIEGYDDVNLHEGISGGAEVIFYNVPYYYCVSAYLYEYSDIYAFCKD